MLTDSGVHAAKPREKRYKLTDSRGLHLLVTPRARTVPTDARQMEPQLDKVQPIGSEPARQAFQLSLSETGELRIANFHQSIRLTAQHTEALRAFLLAELEERRNRHAAD